MRTQFITDNTGKKVAIILSMKDYEKIVEDLEELEDIRLYDEAQKSSAKGIPMEDAFKQIAAKRKKHGLQRRSAKTSN